MIRTLTIENFRCFEQFKLHDLGRVNLLVGSNNSGKTSVLEAVDLLMANGDATVLSRTLARRGEDIEYIERARPAERRVVTRQLDVRRLFHRHRLQRDSVFRLTADVISGNRSLTGDVQPASELDDSQSADLVELDYLPDLAFRLYWGDSPERAYRAGVLSQGGVSAYRFARSQRRLDATRTTTQFVPTASLTANDVIDLFDDIVLTPKENTVIRALQIIEPHVERLATQRTESSSIRGLLTNHRSGILLRLSENDDRVPIGSMGDGMWRLLGLSLSMVQAENAILLIDEIDTGLHYSVMEKMWKLVTETAKRLNIQVFATTHSRDCVESLATVCRESITENSEVTIQRIERGKTRSVAYTEQEIIRAAEYGTEVR